MAQSRKKAAQQAVAIISSAVLLASLAFAPTSASAAMPSQILGIGEPTVAQLVPGITHEENSRVPVGAAWSESYFPSSDGSDVELHADVLRPAGLAADAKTPVILSVGPYFAHIGATANQNFTQNGPNPRFHDLVVDGDLMAKGYTFVTVDLRGYGGSTGCLDFAGPGESADVKAAIAWAASQPWSTGKVAMYGKSYDAVTGLIGNNLKMPELKAVVAQEPLWNMHKYLYSNGLPRENQTATPIAYNSIAALPGRIDDTEKYKSNALYEATHPECFSENKANALISDPNDQYWVDRNLSAHAAGSNTPLFITQGTIESNTKAEDMDVFLANHTGVERGWIGPWDHVRGNDVTSYGALEMGRPGWIAEVMRFFDKNLKGIEPTIIDPNFAIQDSQAVWRAQDSWPEIDATTTMRLAGGTVFDGRLDTLAKFEPRLPSFGTTQSFTQTTEPEPVAPTTVAPFDMENAPQETDALSTIDLNRLLQPGTNGTLGLDPVPVSTNSFISWSEPVTQDLRITATPELNFTASINGNVEVSMWAVPSSGRAIRLSLTYAQLKRGANKVKFPSTDWSLPKGYRLAVEFGWAVGGALYRPSLNFITISQLDLTLGLQDPVDDVPTEGAAAPFLYTFNSTRMRIKEIQPGDFTIALPAAP